MTRAGTGEAHLPALRAVLGAATIALELVIIAVIYFGLAESALLLPVLNPAATPLWPATGVALAVVLLRGYRVGPAIFAGCFAAHAVSSGVVDVRPLVEAGSIALGTTLAACAGAWLINRWSYGRKTFASPLGIGKIHAGLLRPRRGHRFGHRHGRQDSRQQFRHRRRTQQLADAFEHL